MKSVTLEQLKTFRPCWDDGQLEAVANRRPGESWTAMDVLDLPTDVCSDTDKLWAVLREDFIDAPVLHEFACRCAERALSRVDNPDPRSISAIAAKRAWLRGEIDDRTLKAARDAVWTAASTAASTSASTAARYAAWAAARDAARDAARAAASTAARTAASAAADAVARNAASAAADAVARNAAWDAAWAEERAWQVAELRKMLEDGGAANVHETN